MAGLAAGLDAAVACVVGLARRAQERPAAAGPLDVDAHHALAREAAARSIVLLKNDAVPGEDPVLPLRPAEPIAVIGEFARTPRYQGAGSSQIITTRLDDALTAIVDAAEGEVRFAPGFALDGGGDAAGLVEEAVIAAAAADVSVVFLGVPAQDESEGYDRDGIDLPRTQLMLLDAVRRANPRTVVVLSNGGVVALPFVDDVPAILEGWLLGQAGGSATADVLFGAVNPGGKLTETIPLRLEDTPAFGSFPGELGHVRYGEGILVGYRWYDARTFDVAFPFGHGLSYTTFAYSGAVPAIDEGGDLRVEVRITNTGTVRGRETLQVYTSLASLLVQRPPRELKAFAVVDLEPGETESVGLVVPRQDLAY
ncbi:hypothetical protein J2790_003852 [Paenarthrobacter nicotinovorans]|nr:hypothetical protein [Paenarthrobacter nicotinovorans]